MSTNKTFRKFSLLMAGLLMSASLLAGPAVIPNQFTSGTAAVAAQVNANFTALKTAVDDNDSRTTALESTISTLQTDNASLDSRITALESTISTLQGNNASLQDFIAMVLPYLTGGNDNQGNPAVFITGANLHVRDGTGSSETLTHLGLGNIVIGYDEAEAVGTAVSFCSSGLYDNQTDCLNNSEVWGMNQKSASHSLIMGSENSYTQYGHIVSGKTNKASGAFSGAIGGLANHARGARSMVTGGTRNTSEGNATSISGGDANTARGEQTSISGGFGNLASGSQATVSGGSSNTASGNQSSVSGGSSNTASGDQSSVSAGLSNTTNGQHSSISGGELNSTTNQGASVTGGQSNTAIGAASTVSGGLNRSTPANFNWAAGSFLEGL